MSKNKMDLKNIKEYYQDKYKSFGASAQGMDWKDEDSQYLRFEILSKYIDFKENPSILDVGCGSSEFLNYCQTNKFDCNYTGLDMIQEMVDASNSRFGKETAILGDLNSIPEKTKYDYTIASGTFNLKLGKSHEEWQTFFYENLKKMFELSEKGIVFNCMTEHVDWTYDRLYYPSISELTKFINKNLSRNFVIDHSYQLFEITLYVSK